MRPSMISGLLEYAMAGMKRDLVRAVDLNALINGIVATTPGASGFEFRFEGEWPDEIAAPAAPLDLVLRNLIQNAVKHHDCAQGVVTLGLRDLGDRWLFLVADDGPGIVPSLHDAVFEPFRALKGAPGQQGGVGLALVKQTVKKHGGTIEICSDPLEARGALFKIAWPKIEGAAAPVALAPHSAGEIIEKPSG